MELNEDNRIWMVVSCFIIALILLISVFALTTSANDNIENKNTVFVMSNTVAKATNKEETKLPEIPSSLREQKYGKSKSDLSNSLQGQRVQQLTGQVPALTSITIHNHIPTTSYRYYYPKHYNRNYYNHPYKYRCTGYPHYRTYGSRC